MRSRFDSRPFILHRKYTQVLRGTAALDWRTQLVHAFHLFFVILTAVVSRNVANQQLLDAIGPHVLGKLYIGVSLAVGLGLAVVGWLARDIDARKLARTVHMGVALLLVGAYAAPPQPVTLRLVIYIGTELCAALLLLVFGLMLNARLGPREARMTAARIGLGGMLGGLAAGLVLRFGAVTLGSDRLFLLAAGAAFLPLFWLPRVGVARRRRHPPATPAQQQALERYGRWVALTTLLMVTATTIVDYQYRATAAGWYRGDALTAFFGNVTLLTGVVSIGFQLLLLGRLLDRRGLFATASVMPAALAVSSALFGLVPLKATLVLLKVLDSGGNMSVQQATGNLLLAPLSVGARAVWQTRIDGIAKRGGQAIAGFFLDRVLLAPPRLAPVVLLLTGVWLLSLWRTRGRYVRLLGALLRAPAREPVLATYDGATLRRLDDELERAPSARAMAVVDLLERAGRSLPPARLCALLDRHAHDALALRIIELLAAQDALPELEALVGRGEPKVALAALAALAELQTTAASRIAESLVANDEAPAALRAMSTGLLASGGPDTPHLLRRWTSDPDANVRRALARGLHLSVFAESAAVIDALCELTRDDEPDVARAALEALARHPSPSATEATLRALERPQTRTSAMRTLGAFGARAVPSIARELRNNRENASVAAALAWALGNIGSEAAIPALRAALDATHVDVRMRAAVALTALRRRGVAPARLTAGYVDEIAYYARMRDLVRAELPDTPAAKLLQHTARQRGKASLECLFRLLSLQYPEQAIHEAFVALSSQDKRQRQLALELLHSVLDSPLRQAVNLALGERGGVIHNREVRPLLTTLQLEGDRWLRRLADTVLTELGGPHGETGGSMSDPLLDRVLELQAVAIFSESAAEDLAELAELATAVEIESGATIFSRGDPGDTMYVIREGSVVLTTGGRRVDRLSDGDAFGIIAVLDRRPREMNALATSRVRLWSIDADDLLQLLADRPLLMHSIFRALTDALRNQVDRVALGRKRA